MFLRICQYSASGKLVFVSQATDVDSTRGLVFVKGVGGNWYTMVSGLQHATLPGMEPTGPHRRLLDNPGVMAACDRVSLSEAA
jgi:hypothetical protein